MAKAERKSTTRRKAEKARNKMTLKEEIRLGHALSLPFVSLGCTNWWSVRSSGVHWTDRERARAFALAFLDHCVSDRIHTSPYGAGHMFARIVESMIRERRGPALSPMQMHFLEEAFGVAVHTCTHERVAKERTFDAERHRRTFESEEREKGGAA
jgi:hypothetical protein